MDIKITGVAEHQSRCGHKTLETDKGKIAFHISELEDAKAEQFEAVKPEIILAVRRKYQDSRAAGSTSAVALSELIGITVRI
jgi:hypothetical protein